MSQPKKKSEAEDDFAEYIQDKGDISLRYEHNYNKDQVFNTNSWDIPSISDPIYFSPPYKKSDNIIGISDFVDENPYETENKRISMHHLNFYSHDPNNSFNPEESKLDFDLSENKDTLMNQEIQLKKEIKKRKNSKTLRRRRWTPQEDAKVLELVAIHGQRWTVISNHLPQRNPKNIRDRYLNRLAPDIVNTAFSADEDEMIKALVKQIGNKWKEIAGHLQGRTENQVKNHYNLHLKHQMQD